MSPPHEHSYFSFLDEEAKAKSDYLGIYLVNAGVGTETWAF
jgi:hypothetical protein